MSGVKVEELRADYDVGQARPEGLTRHARTVSLSTARLGDVAESMKNGLYKPASEYSDDGVPCLRMYNIEAGQIAWRDIKRMRVTTSELEDYGLREGDLLVNRVNSRELVGKTALIPQGMEPSVFESKNIRLRLKTDQVLPKFINYQLLAFGRQHFSNNAQQVVGMASASQKQLAAFPIVLAPLDQQKRIVAEIEKQFSRLDEAVAGLKRVKVNLKRYKAAVLKAAVEGRLVETEADRARREGRSYETGEQLLQRILETRRIQWQGKGKYKEPAAPNITNLAELPEGWTWANFESAAERVTVGHVGSMKDEYVDDGVPFLRSQNVRPNRYDPEGLKFISQAFHRQLGKSALKPGDIAVVRSGSVGVSCVIPDSLPEANCSDLVIIKSPQAVLPDFGTYYMNSVVETRVAAGKVGIALMHFNTLSVAMLPLPVPPMAEQSRIVAEVDRRLSLLSEAEAQVDANLQRAERLRQSILSCAFRGGTA